MATFKSKIKETVLTYDGRLLITLETQANYLTADTINEYNQSVADYTVSIDKYHEPRSLTANAYLWVLLDKIAEKLGSTKEQTYKAVITTVGVFEMLPIKKEAVAEFKRRWESKGLGWVCEELRESKLKGYTTVMAYYGSSTYNSKEMSRLLDYVVEEAKELGIDVRTPEQIEEMKRLWAENNV